MKYAANLVMTSVLLEKGSSHLKRFIDLSIALPALLVCSPVIALMAILIRIDSPGNPFFTQVRVGRKGRYFVIYKMRTLYTEHFGIVPNEEEPQKYRITRIGKFLRLSKLDELPQLLNVVLGHMSMVGPRPDIPEQAVAYTEFQQQRLLTKPGLTGITQISGNTLLSWPDRIRLDVWYIHNWSWLLDLKVIVLTVLAVLQGESLQADPFHLHPTLPDKNNVLSKEQMAN